MRCALIVAILACAAFARADPPATRYALFRLDPLGIAPEIVAQLEAVLAVELARAVGPLPPRAAVEAAIAKQPAFAGCTGDPACLGPIARALRAWRIVAGNVGGLGDSYVVNLKLVDDRGVEVSRVTATLQGRADELIQEVRVAAYRLVAPEKIVGAISLLSEVAGAEVFVDGKRAGVTPLAGPIAGLSVGEHVLRLARPGYEEYSGRVTVRFEKATEVVVRQRAVSLEARLEEAERTARLPPEPPYHSRWWFWAGASAAAIGLGLSVGGLAAAP